MPEPTPTWESLNRTRFEWPADVAARGGPVKARSRVESMAACLLAAQVDGPWAEALAALRSPSPSHRAIWRMAARALDHIEYLDREQPKPPPSTMFWRGAEGDV